MEDHPFEVRQRDGRVYRVWLNGRIEGFEPNSLVINGMMPLINRAKHVAWLKGIEYASIPARLRRVLVALGLACRTGERQENDAAKQAQRPVKNTS